MEEGNLGRKQAQAFDVESCVIACNVANLDDVQNMVNQVIRRFGKIDILVNNTGITHGSSAENLSLQDWKQMIDVNLTGVFLCAHIVVVPQKQCHYNAAKAGVIMLTKSLAVEWTEHGIRVNSISPGYIKTKIIDFAKDLHPIWAEKTPMKTMGNPEDIAEAILYLASPRAKYVMGSDWIIDGGYTAP